MSLPNEQVPQMIGEEEGEMQTSTSIGRGKRKAREVEVSVTDHRACDLLYEDDLEDEHEFITQNLEGSHNTSDNVNEKEPKNKKVKKEIASRSPWWEHFTKMFCEKDKCQKGKCKYCGTLIKADPNMHGTKGLDRHYQSCKKKPHEVATRQKILNYQPTNARGQKSGGVLWEFDQEKIRDALCHWFIVDEMPFRTVEKDGFRHFMSVACPQFTIPSRRTITRDIFKMYMNEKSRLKSYINEHAQRVCITTNTRTSMQSVNYMCLTVHFIDDD